MKMTLSKALAIFMEIDDDRYTVQEKGEAIWTVLNMATHNGVKKDWMLNVIRWLWDNQFEMKKEVE